MLMKSPSCWLTLNWSDGDQDQMWEQRLVLGGSPNHALLRVCLAHHPASSAEALLGWLWSLLGSWGTDWRVMGTRTRGKHLIITWDLECFNIVWGWLLGVGVLLCCCTTGLTSRSSGFPMRSQREQPWISGTLSRAYLGNRGLFAG